MPSEPEARSRSRLRSRRAVSQEITHALQQQRLAPLGLLLAGCLAVTAAQAEHAQSPEGATLETVEIHGRQLQLNLQREQSLTPGGVTLIDSNLLF